MRDISIHLHCEGLARGPARDHVARIAARVPLKGSPHTANKTKHGSSATRGPGVSDEREVSSRHGHREYGEPIKRPAGARTRQHGQITGTAQPPGLAIRHREQRKRRPAGHEQPGRSRTSTEPSSAPAKAAPAGDSSGEPPKVVSRTAGPRDRGPVSQREKSTEPRPTLSGADLAGHRRTPVMGAPYG